VTHILAANEMAGMSSVDFNFGKNLAKSLALNG